MNQFKGKAKILAGGTDLLVQMKRGKIAPEYLINIKNISDLDRIEYDVNRGLTIGSLALIADLQESYTIRDRFPILHGALSQLGTQQVRNIATIGGNLCNASPAAETAPALIALGASAKIVGHGGEKVVKLEDFFVEPGKTVLKIGQILIEIQIPNVSPDCKGIYLKHALRRKLETAIVGVAVSLSTDFEYGPVKEANIVLGAAAPIPKRALKAEQLAKGKKIDQHLLNEIASVASEESSPITDVRATAEYRREMVKVLVKRAFTELIKI